MLAGEGKEVWRQPLKLRGGPGCLRHSYDDTDIKFYSVASKTGRAGALIRHKRRVASRCLVPRNEQGDERTTTTSAVVAVAKIDLLVKPASLSLGHDRERVPKIYRP